MPKTIKTYSHTFFRNALAPGAADVNIIEFRNIEGGKRRKLLTITSFIIATDNVTNLGQAVVNHMPAVGTFVQAFLRIQEIQGGAIGMVGINPEVINAAVGVGNGTGNGVRLNVNEKTEFKDFTFIEGIRVTTDINNGLANAIYYEFQIIAEIEIQ